jgi:hypothetical protein
MSKAEQRRLRKLEQAEKIRADSERLSKSMSGFVRTPRVAPVVALPRGPKVAVSPSTEKTAKTGVDPESGLFALQLTWCSTQSDIKDKWSWGETRAWTEQEFSNDIKANFSEMQKLTWGMLLNEQKVAVKGGKQVPKHHYQDIQTLPKEARDRWTELDLEQHETAFRFRFGNLKRAWGIRINAHFYLVWWERQHKIYPVG